MDNIDRFRASLVNQLEDLLGKIKDNEPLPHREQDLSLIIGIGDRVEECLNNWYY